MLFHRDWGVPPARPFKRALLRWTLTEKPPVSCKELLFQNHLGIFSASVMYWVPGGCKCGGSAPPGLRAWLIVYPRGGGSSWSAPRWDLLALPFCSFSLITWAAAAMVTAAIRYGHADGANILQQTHTHTHTHTQSIPKVNLCISLPRLSYFGLFLDIFWKTWVIVWFKWDELLLFRGISFPEKADFLAQMQCQLVAGSLVRFICKVCECGCHMTFGFHNGWMDGWMNGWVWCQVHWTGKL